MNSYEYNEALNLIEAQRELVLKLKHEDTSFKNELSKFINLLITVKGHSWCMDVASERVKITNLIVGEIEQVLK